METRVTSPPWRWSTCGLPEVASTIPAPCREIPAVHPEKALHCGPVKFLMVPGCFHHPPDLPENSCDVETGKADAPSAESNR